MINLKNTQRKIFINLEQLKKDAQRLLSVLGYTDFDLGIWITTDATIRRFNKEFRHKNKPTDILSFPYHTQRKAGQKIHVQSEEDKNLGDLLISAEYIWRDAPRYQMSFEDRLRVLLVHGVCHLLGYDHMTDADYKHMRAKEAWLLKQL